MSNIYPLSDEYMIYNEQLRRYILTEKDVLENLGIDLPARLRCKNGSSNANSINALLNLASVHVYRFIHEHNVNNDWQDCVIANTQKGRQIIKEAMEQQLIYLLTIGDLSRSTDSTKRAFWFDDTARDILYQTIPEIGTTILYTGR